MTKIIPLSQDKEAKVCDCHYSAVAKYKWYYHSSGYAMTKQITGVTSRMHRVVMGEPPSFVIDHINGDKLDNTCQNLRLATRAENVRNSVKRSTNKSGIKGVHFHKHTGKWRSQITLDYKVHSLGLFSDIESAQDAYREAAVKYHKEFARTI